MHPSAEHDLDLYLSHALVTPDDDKGDRFVFQDKHHGVEIEMEDPKALQKIAEHIAKTREHWIRPALGPGSGTAAVRPPSGTGKPQTPDEAREAFIQGMMADTPLRRQG